MRKYIFMLIIVSGLLSCDGGGTQHVSTIRNVIKIREIVSLFKADLRSYLLEKLILDPLFEIYTKSKETKEKVADSVAELGVHATFSDLGNPEEVHQCAEGLSVEECKQQLLILNSDKLKKYADNMKVTFKKCRDWAVLDKENYNLEYYQVVEKINGCMIKNGYQREIEIIMEQTGVNK